MSIFLKPNVLKARDTDGEFKGIDVVAESTIDEYRSTIQTIGNETVSEVSESVEEIKTEAISTIENKGEETLDSIPDDYTELVNEVATIKSDLSEKASAIISSASGSIAHFEDGSEGDAVDVVAYINPVQAGSGNPSPTNVRPISGFTGMNISVSDEDTANPTVYPIAFPTEAGTVYGGYVDVTKGELVVDRASDTINSNNTLATVGTSGHGWYVVRGSMTKPPLITGENYSDGVICDRLKTLIASSSIADNVIFVNNSGQIRINTGEVFASKSDLFAGLGGSITVTYPIEPVTYDITPTQIELLLGTNNVWNDCNGSTNVEYRSDTKLFIEQLTKPTEDDMVANTAIASGKFFMVANRLFISTTTIASGDTINPETNCTELSLADALNNLNS